MQAPWPDSVEAEARFEHLGVTPALNAPSFRPSPQCLKTAHDTTVAVVGGGLGGLMAALDLCRYGFKKVMLLEARKQVGGRVLSDTAFSKGRITEAGAELIGTFHHRWHRLAIHYGLAFINRMDGDLYGRAGLAVRETLDRPLTMKEIEALDEAMKERVLAPISKEAMQIVEAARPWLQQAQLTAYDGLSVAAWLNRRGITRQNSARLWMHTEMLLVNDNVATLEEMNLLGLMCLVKGGGFFDPKDRTETVPMAYWRGLELYRCADGCQTLALKMADEIAGKYDSRGVVLRQAEVTHIDLAKRSLAWRRVDSKGDPIDGAVPGLLRFDYVVLAIPPSVWGPVLKVTPQHPKDTGRSMHMGPAVKYISDVKKRFWVREGAAPYGGSPKLGQVWEGTDNQTRVGKQGVLLNVFAGRNILAKSQFGPELEKLYPATYKRNLNKVLFADWPAERFIKTGYTAPALGQVLTVGRKLNEPFLDRMVFAGDHTRMDLFGYMEGALASGEDAARTVLELACGIWKAPAPLPPPPARGPVRVAEAEARPDDEGAADDEGALEAEVFGSDDRVPVTDTLLAPQRWICAIDILVANPQWGKGGSKFIVKSRATGVLIGPRHVLTVAHVLDKQPMDIDGKVREVDVAGLWVSPARNGDNDDHPFGKASCKALRVSRPYRLRRTGMQGTQPIEYTVPWHDDYALILLDRDLAARAHPKVAGPLGHWGADPAIAQLRRLDPAALNGREIIVNGYPGDRCGKKVLAGDRAAKTRQIEYCMQRSPDVWASTQWAARGVAEPDAQSTDLFHTADTYNGQSGAPICLRADGRVNLVGLHTAPAGTRNKGVRVTRRMLGEICGWMNADAGRAIAGVVDDALVLLPAAIAGKP